jgi:hypothetical protein
MQPVPRPVEGAVWILRCLQHDVSMRMSDHCPFRRIVHCRLSIIRAAKQLIYLCVGLNATTSIASIILPADVSYSLELCDHDARSTCASGAGESAESSSILVAPQDRNSEDIRQLVLHAAHTGGTSNSSSTSTSGGSGFSSCVASSSAANAVVRSFDLALVSWISNDQHLFLPVPAGAELLRPPQST